MNLITLASVCAVAAGGSYKNEEGVMVMDMHTHVRHEHRPIVYADQKVGSLPLGGNIWPVAIYWVNVQVGTPPRTFPVAVDTGSYTLDIPDASCTTCVRKAPNNQYDASASSTSKPIGCGLGCLEMPGFCGNNSQCQYSNTYETCDLTDPTAPCTITGGWWTDEVSFGDASGSVKVEFGSITSQTKNFDQFGNIDGVMGLAGPATAKNTFQLLVNAGKLPANVFAMCFVEGKTSNGTITFGGLDKRLYEGEITYVPDTGSEFYSVELKSISVGGKVAPGTSSTKAILDSGTNILLLPSVMYASVKGVFTDLCNAGAQLPGVCNTTNSIFDGTCYEYTPAQMALFPNMTLALDGIDLHMQPRNYLLQGQPSKAPNVYCLGMRDTGAGGLLIIGDSTMENYYMVMDRAEDKIGWAPVNRTSCGSIGAL